MKRLAKHGWIDIAIRKNKGLLILICESREQAKYFFSFLSMWLWDFRMKNEKDRFELKLRVHRQGFQIISLTPDHPSFLLTKNFLGTINRFTTGCLLPNGQLGYLKESTPLY
ncbi:MAG: hypothetical protein WBJ10_08000, partial [Daejeonella sp.]|uniref:hypothetical protein n=1 Tax=Daejeonella sp. TaxID=2805397 RepID=UPI003C760658